MPEFKPPADAVLTKKTPAKKSGWTPPSDAVELKKKEPTDLESLDGTSVSNSTSGTPNEPAPWGQINQTKPAPTTKPKEVTTPNYGLRNDGTNKGLGYFGALKMKDGSNKDATEISIGIEIDGKETEIPTLVPTLTEQEKEWLLKGNNPNDRSAIGETISKKAIDFAYQRKKEGKPYFATDEDRKPAPNLKNPEFSQFGLDPTKELAPNEPKKPFAEVKTEGTKPLTEIKTTPKEELTPQAKLEGIKKDMISIPGVFNTTDYFNKKADIFADYYLDDKQKEEYSFIKNARTAEQELQTATGELLNSGLPADQLESNPRIIQAKANIEKANADYQTYVQAKNQGIDNQIQELKSKQEGALFDWQKRDYQKEIETLNSQKEGFFKDKVEAAYAQNKGAIDEMKIEGKTPKERMVNYYLVLQKEANELDSELYPNGVRDVVRQSIPLLGTDAEAKKKERLDQIEQTLKQLSPIVLINRSPLKGDEGFFSTMAKKATNVLLPNSEQVVTTEKQDADNLSMAMAQSAITPKDVNYGVNTNIKNKVNSEEPWSANWAGSLVGTTAGMIPSFMGGGALLNSTKIPRLLNSALGATKFGRFIATATEEGLAYEAAGYLNPNDSQLQSESSFMSGFLGSGFSQVAMKAIGAKAIATTFNKFFGDNASKAVKIVSNIGGRTASGLGETAEEFGNSIGSLVDLYQETKDWGEVKKQFDDQFGTLDKTLQFFASTMIMGMGMGGGTQLGRQMTAAAKDQYASMTPEQQAKADEIVGALNNDVKTAAVQAVKEEVKNGATPPENIPLTEEQKVAVDEAKHTLMNENATPEEMTRAAEIVNGAEVQIRDNEIAQELEKEQTAKRDELSALIPQEEVKTEPNDASTEPPQITTEAINTPNEEEGSVGVGGDVESTTKALEEVSKTKPTLWEKIKEAVKSVGKKFGIVSNADHINNFNTAKAEWDKLSSREKKLKRADYELDDLHHTEGGYYKVGNSLIDLDLNSNHLKLLLENNKFLNILNKLGVTKIHGENRPAEEMFAHYSDGKIHLNNNSAFENIRQVTNAMSHELGHHEWTKLTKEERDYVRSLPLETGMAKHYEAQEKNGGKQTSASLQEENFADYVMQYFQGKLYGDEALLNKIPAKLREMFDNKYSDLLKDNEHLDIAEAYHKAKADGTNTELVKAVEQSLKETIKAEPSKSDTAKKEDGGTKREEAGESEDGSPRVSGIKKALVADDVIDSIGIDRRSAEEMLAQGKEAVDNGSVDPENIVEEIVNKEARALQPIEVAALVYYKTQLDNKIATAYEKKVAAEQENNFMDAAAQEAEISKLERKRTDYEVMQVKTAYEQSLAFRLRRMLLDSEFNLQTMVAKYRAKNGGTMPAEVRAKFEEDAKKLEELNDRIEKLEEEKRAFLEKEAFAKIQEEVAKANSQKKTSIREETKRIADKIRKGKTSRPSMFLSSNPAAIAWDGALEITATAIEVGGSVAQAIKNGLDHIRETDWYKGLSKGDKDAADTQFREYVYKKAKVETGVTVIDGKVKIPHDIIRGHVENGVKDIDGLVEAVKKDLEEDYPEITDRQIRDAITNYGKTITQSKDEIEKEIRRIKRVGKLVSALEDVKEKQQRPLRSGLQRDELSVEERMLTKELNAEMKKLPQSEDENTKAWKSALDGIKSRLKNSIEELERRISTGEKTPKKASTPYDAEALDLKAKKDALREQLDALEGKQEMSDEQRVKLAVSGLERSIKNLEEKIDNKEFEAKAKTPKTPQTPQIVALKNQLKDLQGQYKELQKEAGIPEKKRLENYKTRAKNQIKALEDKIARGDYSRKAKTPPMDFDAEALKLEAEKIKIKDRFEYEFEKAELAKRSKMKKRWDAFLNIINLPKSLITTLDMSAPLRQGLMFTLPRIMQSPLKSAKAFGEMFKYAYSEKYYEDWLATVKASPNYPLIKNSKLFISESKGKASAREEGIISTLLDKVPLLKGSARAYTGYLNQLRVDVFTELSDNFIQMGMNPKTKPKEFEALARYINNATGRGDLGSFEMAANDLAQAFFSPRLIAARLRVMNPAYYYKMPPATRKRAAIETTKFVASMMIVSALANLYAKSDDDDDVKFELDPRSSEFLKLKIGDSTFVDFAGGFQQYIRTFWQSVVTGEKKKADGTIEQLGAKYGGTTKSENAFDLFKNKLSPIPSLAWRMGETHIDKKGERVDKYGKPIDYAQIARDLSIPLYATDLRDIYKKHGAGTTAVLGLASFFGVGVSDYDNKSKAKTTKHLQ